MTNNENDQVESGQSEEGVTLTRRQMVGMAAVGGAALLGLSGCGTATQRVNAEDRADITDLFARYAWAYDCQDIDTVLETFTEDAVMEAFGREHVEGHEALREHFEFLYREFRKDAVWWHMNDHHVFEGHGDENCRVYSYWILLQGDTITEGLKIRSTGYYITDCVKKGDNWLIAKRNIQRWDPKQVPWKKSEEST